MSIRAGLTDNLGTLPVATLQSFPVEKALAVERERQYLA